MSIPLVGNSGRDLGRSLFFSHWFVQNVSDTSIVDGIFVNPMIIIFKRISHSHLKKQLHDINESNSVLECHEVFGLKSGAKAQKFLNVSQYVEIVCIMHHFTLIID